MEVACLAERKDAPTIKAFFNVVRQKLATYPS